MWLLVSKSVSQQLPIVIHLLFSSYSNVEYFFENSDGLTSSNNIEPTVRKPSKYFTTSDHMYNKLYTYVEEFGEKIVVFF